MNAIPFLPRFHHFILTGQKTATARTKAYGKAGDRVRAWLHGESVILLLDSVEPEKLGIIAEKFWREEGCDSPVQFREIWARIHPRKPYDPQLVVFFHRFHVEEEGK